MKWTVANLLTGSRIVLSLVFLVFALGSRWVPSFWIFIVAAFTDLIDGSVARLLNQRSEAGAILDGIADKLLMFFGFLVLTIMGWLPVWLTLLVIFKDLMVTYGFFHFRFRNIKIDYRSTILSKLTTLSQILVLSLVLLNAAFQTGDVVFGYDRPLAGIMTLLTIIQYFREGLGILRKSNA